MWITPSPLRRGQHLRTAGYPEAGIHCVRNTERAVSKSVRLCEQQLFTMIATGARPGASVAGDAAARARVARPSGSVI